MIYLVKVWKDAQNKKKLSFVLNSLENQLNIVPNVLYSEYCPISGEESHMKAEFKLNKENIFQFIKGLPSEVSIFEIMKLEGHELFRIYSIGKKTDLKYLDDFDKSVYQLLIN
jgi:hypothetical protein